MRIIVIQDFSLSQDEIKNKIWLQSLIWADEVFLLCKRFVSPILKTTKMLHIYVVNP